MNDDDKALTGKAVTEGRAWLERWNTAESAEWATATALAGLLALATEGIAAEQREESYRVKWIKAYDALDRVMELADILDANPHATLKPTAFTDLATKIRSAVDGGAR